MNYLKLKNIIFILLLGLGGQAQATIIANGGTFDFGGFTWTTNYDDEYGYEGGGFIEDIDTPLEQVNITGSDLGNSSFTITQMTTTATAAGSVSFFWDYETLDIDPTYDPFVALLNGIVIDIADPFGGLTQNGLFEFTGLEIGDIFGFSIDTVDDDFGYATANIRTDGVGFRPNPVPEPSIFALFGLGLVGLGLARRKNRLVSH